MAKLLHQDGTEEEIQPQNGTDFSLHELQGYVGGYIEIVHLPDGDIMVVDDEGLFKNYFVNEKASLLAGQAIVGDAVVCKSEQVK